MNKIIIIEDDKYLLENIESILELENYKVFTADNGKAGIKLIEEIIPDLIISDIMLPDIEGFDILKHVRSVEIINTIPFIFLTARTNSVDLRSGMNLGADDYLTKPFNAKDLLLSITTRLELAKNRMQKNQGNDNALNNKDTIFIKDLKGIQNVKIEDFVCINALGEYSEIILNTGKKITAKKLLKDWEKLLPSDHFVRVHRSNIINLKFILKVEEWFNFSLKIYLQHCKEPIISSRRYSAKIKKEYFV